MSLQSSLMDIYREHGELTPVLVVDAARPNDSPLHDRFEWDDHAAGEAYRLVQARALIRSVKITYGDDEDRPSRKVPAWSSVAYETNQRVRSYQPTEEMMRNDKGRLILLRQMERDWRVFKDRYQKYSEFADLVELEADSINSRTDDSEAVE